MSDARDEARAALERLFRPALGEDPENPELIRETACKLDAWADEIEKRALQWALPYFKEIYSSEEGP